MVNKKIIILKSGVKKQEGNSKSNIFLSSNQKGDSLKFR